MTRAMNGSGPGRRNLRRLAPFLAVVILALTGANCAQLHFLKPASVPTPKGESSTERGKGTTGALTVDYLQCFLKKQMK